MNKISAVMVIMLAWQTTANGQSGQERIGGPCEGCEAIFEYGSMALKPEATLPDFKDQGPKLKVTGLIYQRDGKTPARDVILYIYHTDQSGVYPTTGKESGWGRRHGYLRGWIKTDESGRYTFYTLKPASYPERNAPAHIHATIKEPGKNAYWIDEYLFEGDPLLTSVERKSQTGRCGNGIITLKRDATGMLVAERDLVLGLNIPDYP